MTKLFFFLFKKSGDKGSTGKRILENANNNFERGKIDNFFIDSETFFIFLKANLLRIVFILAVDIGDIKKILIGHVTHFPIFF